MIDSAIYLVASLRNVGSGIAVLHGWYVHTERESGAAHVLVDDFRRLNRDLYIAPGETGFWQGAMRDPNDPAFVALSGAIEARTRLGLEILYGDHELGQRAITLFGMTPRDDGSWLLSVARHWNVDRPDPR